MKNFTLQELFDFRESLVSGDYSKADLDIVNEIISQKQILEDDGGSFSSGMGDVISAQPSTNAGSLSGPSWSDGGGSIGSGDIGVPINLGSRNSTTQRIKSPLGRNHGASTGKKSRKKKLDLKGIRTALKSRGRSGKILSFDKFSKDLLNTVTRVKEGRIYKGAKLPHEGKEDFSNRKEDFRDKIENLLKSLDVNIDRIGNDFEASKNEIIIQIMFRDNVISLKKEGDRYTKDFSYSQFGKVKSEIISIYK